MSLERFVSRLTYLAELTEADRRIVTALSFSLVKIDRHREILTRGERPQYLYTVLSGWAGRYALRADGSRRTPCSCGGALA